MLKFFQKIFQKTQKITEIKVNKSQIDYDILKYWRLARKALDKN